MIDGKTAAILSPAYRLRGDILDLTSTADEMGKPVNADLPEGIYTLPVIRATARDRGLGRLLRRGPTGEEAARARELVITSGAVEEAQALADEFLDQVAGRLAAVSADPRACHAMTAYVRSALDRRTLGPAVSRQSAQPLGARGDTVPPEVERWLKSWMLDIGLAVSPAELDYHRWSGAIQIPASALAPAANAVREQTVYGMAVLVLVWDGLFEDPQLRDPQAVTALRGGLVAMLHHAPETLRGKGAGPEGVGEFVAAPAGGPQRSPAGSVPRRPRGVVRSRRTRSAPSHHRLHSPLRPTICRCGGRPAGSMSPSPVHETGRTRGEAIEQVQRRTAENRAQLEEVIRYVPARSTTRRIPCCKPLPAGGGVDREPAATQNRQ